MNTCKSEDMGGAAWKSEPSIVASMPGQPCGWRLETMRDRYAARRREERLRGLSPEELVRSLRPEDRLLGLSNEELVRLKDLLERRTSGQR